MSDERTWLKHPETGHFFHCPTPAVEDWLELGWQVTDERPEEINPVVAERLAWEAQQRAAREAAAPQPEEEQSITAPAGSAPESEE
jgi:hypothetical protein